MKPKTIHYLVAVAAMLFCSLQQISAQIYPLSLDQRVVNSPVIAVATLVEKQSYWDVKRENIYTRNVLKVKAYLKGGDGSELIAAISPGGIVDDQAEFVCPAETYEPNTDYLVFLKDEERNVDDKRYRATHPGIRQCKSYAGIQSVWPYVDGIYKDAGAAPAMTEQELLSAMRSRFALEAKSPNGSIYHARNTPAGNSQRLLLVTSITDGTGSLPATGFVSATIPANNELIINGSGFGATTGSVLFANANDGGATNISTSANDIISWSDAQVRVKIPDLAGTGTLIVRDNTNASVGTSPITIKWGEINVTNTFSGFGSAQRQQVRLLNRNGSGGYTFEYSTNTTNGPSFAGDASAKSSFQRALRTLRCATLVNFNVSTGSNAAGFANDDINIVMYDNVGLPAGALAVCTSRFNASAVGGLCDNFNTVWYLKEMDIQVLSVPVPGFTWNFSTAAPTGTQFDFESVMLHEAGHGHGLRHVILPSATMHYAIANGSAKRSFTSAETEGGQYRIAVSNSNCLNTNGFGGFVPHAAISPALCSVLLPVSLLDFYGEVKSASIDLKWTTERESNAKGFYVEKSTDAINFRSIGFVPAAGNTNSIRQYTLPDNTREAVNVYYRLKMEDIDNQFSYSKTISFKPANNGWKIFPNPAKEKFYVVPEKVLGTNTTLQVNDMAGRMVVSVQLPDLQPGVAVPIQVKKLLPGMYIVKIVAGNQTLLTEKLYKQ